MSGAVFLGMILALGDQPENSRTTHHDSSLGGRVERSAERFDGVLQRGFSQKTHDELAQHAQQAQDWFTGIGENVANAGD